MEYVRRRKLRGPESLDELHANTNLVRLPGRRGELCGTIVDRLFAQSRMTRPRRYSHHAYPFTALIGCW